MAKRDTDKTVEGKACLTVSDWVAFLTSEKHGMTNTIVNFAMLLAVLIALIFSTRGNTTMQNLGYGIFAFALLAYVWLLVWRPFGQRGKLAERILDEIISGEFKDADNIRKEWVVGLAVIKRRRWCRLKTRLTILKRTCRHRRRSTLAALKRAWDQGKARLIALKQAWWRGKSSDK